MKIGFLNPKFEDNTRTLSTVDKGTTQDSCAALTQGLLRMSKSSLRNQSLM